MSPPERVARSAALFERSGAWHRLSRNSRATSCRDAASRRQRLGVEGIPLYDELKSLCVVVYRPEGRSYALLHCRAHQRLDLDAAARVLGTTRPLARLSAEELDRELHTAYGTVTPFAEADRFIQVFDRGVLASLTAPHTMMTNAGEHTWGVEFDPATAIEALRTATEVHVADISVEATGDVGLPSFGILTGNGPESGQALWVHVNEAIHRGLRPDQRAWGDLAYPRVMVHSEPDMGLSMELEDREDAVRALIGRAVDRFVDADINTITIACNTTQWFAEFIRARCGGRARFLSMVDVLGDYLRSQQLRDLTIIGIPAVASLGEYSAYRALTDLGVRPVHERARPHLQELGYLVKRLALGEKSGHALNVLRHVLTSGVDTENVIIALTEISVLLQRFPKFADQLAGRRIIDPLKLYGDAMAQLYLDALPAVTDEDGDAWG